MSKGPKHTNKIVEEMKANLKPILDGKCSKMITVPKEGELLYKCSRATEGNTCKVYQMPELQWRRGDCPMADNPLRTVIEVEDTSKVRVGQQKQKKKL